MTDTELDRLAEGWDEEGVIYGETVRALLTECRRARAEAAALRAGPVPPAVVGLLSDARLAEIRAAERAGVRADSDEWVRLALLEARENVRALLLHAATLSGLLADLGGEAWEIREAGRRAGERAGERAERERCENIASVYEAALLAGKAPPGIEGYAHTLASAMVAMVIRQRIQCPALDRAESERRAP